MGPGTDMEIAPLERVSPAIEALKQGLLSALLSAGLSATGTALMNRRYGRPTSVATGLAATAGGTVGALLGSIGGYAGAKQDNRVMDIIDKLRNGGETTGLQEYMDLEEETDPQMKTAAVDGFMVGYMQKRSKTEPHQELPHADEPGSVRQNILTSPAYVC